MYIIAPQPTSSPKQVQYVPSATLSLFLDNKRVGISFLRQLFEAHTEQVHRKERATFVQDRILYCIV